MNVIEQREQEISDRILSKELAISMATSDLGLTEDEAELAYEEMGFVDE